MPTAVSHFHAAAASRAAGQLEESAHKYAAALALAPTMVEAYLNVAWVLSELGRTPEAITAYQHGLRHRRWPPDTAAAAHNNLGVLMRDAQRGTEATAAFRAALEARPDFGPALDNIGGTGDAAAAVDPAQFVHLINAANGLYARGAYAEAAELYRRALPLRDARQDGAAYVGLGAALHGGRRLSEAKHVLVAGARLNPASPGMLANLATVRTDLGHWRAASTAWRRALILTPNDAAGYRSAASALQRGSRLEEALPLLAHTARLDPANWHAHYAHASTLLRLGYAAPTTTGGDGGRGGGDGGGGEGEGGRASRPWPHVTHAAASLAALRPMHRLPISLEMRARSRALPPWTREGGRGLLGDEISPLDLDAIWRAQAPRRAEAARAGRQAGVIIYKLGPKPSELDNLRLSLTLLTRHHNRAFAYPILIAHDEPLSHAVMEELRGLCAGVALTFERLLVALPAWVDPREVRQTWAVDSGPLLSVLSPSLLVPALTTGPWLEPRYARSRRACWAFLSPIAT